MSENPKTDLHNLLQYVLRERPACRYHDLIQRDGKFRTLLSIGTGEWSGSSQLSQQDAQQNAAFNANLQIQSLASEAEVRQLIGLPHRKHLAEIDYIRDAAWQLKQRYKQVVTKELSAMAYYDIRNMLHAVNVAEANLISNVGVYD